MTTTGNMSLPVCKYCHSINCLNRAGISQWEHRPSLGPDWLMSTLRIASSDIFSSSASTNLQKMEAVSPHNIPRFPAPSLWQQFKERNEMTQPVCNIFCPGHTVLAALMSVVGLKHDQIFFGLLRDWMELRCWDWKNKTDKTGSLGSNSRSVLA